MPTIWGRIALSTIVLCALFVLDGLPADAAGSPTTAGPLLSLVSQTPWVTPNAPSFSLDLAVGSGAGPSADLHVSVTIYDRIDDASQLAQVTDNTPDNRVLARVSPLPVTAGASGLTASTCIVVLTESSTTAPGTPGACPAGGDTVQLPCELGGGPCDDVYPVSVALLRTGDSTPVARFTTFITYEEPDVAVSAAGGPLRVSWIVPVQSAVTGRSAAADGARASTEQLVGLLSRRNLPVTLDVNPTTTLDLQTHGGREGQRTNTQLATLTTPPGPDDLLTPTYAPIDLAAMVGAGLASEIPLQVNRASQLVHLVPTPGYWVENDSDLSSTDAANLTDGLSAVQASHLVVDDAALVPSANPDGSTFAHPFTLALAHGTRVSAVASNSQLDSRFTADPGDPTLAADQLLAGLYFIHFENEFLSDPRGVVIVPPDGWQPTNAFDATLLTGLTNSQIVTPVTLSELFSQVAPGGNGDPATRQLQSGSGVGNGGITPGAAARILAARSGLNSYGAATGGRVGALSTLSDQLLGTESAHLSKTARAAALDGYDRNFDAVLSKVSLAVERTVTFTSRTAYIPITVLSSAPYQIKVLLTLSSDRFTFPGGANRTLVLAHAVTSVRVEARARTSGDRLPVMVTLRTPNGALVITQAVLTVHSTEISLVGVALTLLAALVLLVWWVRTWRRSRRHRPRAH